MKKENESDIWDFEFEIWILKEKWAREFENEIEKRNQNCKLKFRTLIYEGNRVMNWIILIIILLRSYNLSQILYFLWNIIIKI